MTPRTTLNTTSRPTSERWSRASKATERSRQGFSPQFNCPLSKTLTRQSSMRKSGLTRWTSPIAWTRESRSTRISSLSRSMSRPVRLPTPAPEVIWPHRTWGTACFRRLDSWWTIAQTWTGKSKSKTSDRKPLLSSDDGYHYWITLTSWFIRLMVMWTSTSPRWTAAARTARSINGIRPPVRSIESKI